ncbi:hypothetical protein [Bilifractor porci]|uniref:Uncharacterized protein n=1 Tax=Bilifractor porci TaxID=2606636 RepID=A0A7X2TPQ5_9FIRM|nr:hypothetical protein [Bilifractor porci]MST82855.1 hypothetical protein [Bilifractor porci]
MILEIYRGNGLTELIEESEYELEKSHQANQQISSGIPSFPPNSRNNGKVKGYFIGRDGIPIVFNRLLHSGRKK